MDPRDLRLVLFTFHAIALLGSRTSATEIGTYCQNEVFEGECQPDEVVLIRLANYGRMKLSKCVRKDYGYIGCGSDVTNIAHAFCSGRRKCTIPVPNEQLDLNPPCPEDFKSYLEAAYDCIKVIKAERSQCDRATSVEITAPEGIIASVVTKETGCGSHKAPWVIKARPGQRINVTLLDFAVHGMGFPVDESRCIAYAIFREKIRDRRSTLCGARKVEDIAYTSVGHELEVLILGAQTPETTRHFLLKYTVTGCADLAAPPGGWVRRDGDVLHVGCRGSDETWKVTCKNSHWLGEIGNCSSAGGAGGAWPEVPVSFGVSIGIIILIALGIAGCILLAGLVCMQRRRRDLPRKTQAPPPLPVTEMGVSDDYKKALYGYSRQKSSGDPRSDIYWSRRGEGGPMTENEYASIQDNFPPPISPTGSAMPDVDFAQTHGGVQSSSFQPPPYRGDTGMLPPHPGHFNTGNRSQKRGQGNPSPPRMREISHSTDTLDTEGREYFVLDPEDTRPHKMVHINDR